MIGRFGGGVKSQKRKGDKSPMIQAGRKKEVPSAKVEPPPGMENNGGVGGKGIGESPNVGVNMEGGGGVHLKSHKTGGG